MKISEKLVAQLATQQGINPALLYRVSSAHGATYSDGSVYIKLSNPEEIAIVQQLYPDYFTGALSEGNTHAFGLKNLGTTIAEAEVTVDQLEEWVAALQDFWKANLPSAAPRLDTQKEIRAVYKDLGQDPRGIKPLIDALLATSYQEPTESTPLHGDPNFRNVCFDKAGTARLIDFDHARKGPIEWDMANLLMVCRIAGRNDLYGHAAALFATQRPGLLDYYMRIRLAQTLVHTVAHSDFETEAGLQRRLVIARNYLRASKSTVVS